MSKRQLFVFVPIAEAKEEWLDGCINRKLEYCRKSADGTEVMIKFKPGAMKPEDRFKGRRKYTYAKAKEKLLDPNGGFLKEFPEPDEE